MLNKIVIILRNLCLFIMLGIAIFGLCLTLFGCTQMNVIGTNAYIQQDYDSDCYKSGNTYNQVVLCLAKDREAEHNQNHITNEMINGNK